MARPAGTPAAIAHVAAGVVPERPGHCYAFHRHTELSAVQMTTSSEERPAAVRNFGAPEPMSPLAIRVHGEYREMPGLRLTVRQAARLFSVDPGIADAVLHELRQASILACSNDGAFALIGAPSLEGRDAGNLAAVIEVSVKQ